MTRESEPVRIEITEDSSAGMRVRLHSNGRLPDVLAGFPRHILRKARPWFWSSYERQVIKAARPMPPHARRVVRHILIAERARTLMERSQQPKREGWIARWRRARGERKGQRQALDGLLPTYKATRELHEPYRTHVAEPSLKDRQAPALLPAGLPREGAPPASSDRAAENPELLQERSDQPSLAEALLEAERTVAELPQEPGSMQHESLAERLLAGSALTPAIAMPSRERSPSDRDRSRSR